jgi:hypothetical protein
VLSDKPARKGVVAYQVVRQDCNDAEWFHQYRLVVDTGCVCAAQLVA